MMLLARALVRYMGGNLAQMSHKSELPRSRRFWRSFEASLTLGFVSGNGVFGLKFHDAARRVKSMSIAPQHFLPNQSQILFNMS